MPYALRTFTCPDCGARRQKRRPAGAVVRCPPCAIEYSAEEQRQLHAHQGEHYQRWLWASLTGIRRVARASPLVEVRRSA